MGRAGNKRFAGRASLAAALGVIAALLAGMTAAAGARSTPTASAPRAHAALVGGSAASPGMFPGLALISDDIGNGETAYCTGTVVSANLILTAAHCLEDDTGALEPASGFTVATGTVDPTDDPDLSSSVSQLLIYPGYDRGEDNGDAGLLLLNTPTTAPAVTLAASSDTSDSQSGTAVAVAGWGLTSPTATAEPATLQWASMAIQDTSYCQLYDNADGLEFQFAYEFCAVGASGTTVSVCPGDSGGPAFAMPAPNTLIEVGIIDRGDDNCATGVPSIFTYVNLVQSWVEAQIAAYPPPAASDPPAASGGGAAVASSTPSPAVTPAATTTTVLAAAASGHYAGSSAQRHGRVTLTLGAGGITAVSLKYNLRCGGAWRGPFAKTKSLGANPVKLVAHAGAWTFATSYKDGAGDRFVLSGRLPALGRAVGSFSVTTPKQRCKSGAVAWSASLATGAGAG